VNGLGVRFRPKVEYSYTIENLETSDSEMSKRSPKILKFTTSALNWKNGFWLLVVAAGLFAFYFSGAPYLSYFLIALGLALAGILCVLGRYSMTIYLREGKIERTSGIWPKVNHSTEGFQDYDILEMTSSWRAKGNQRTYHLWLHGEKRKVCLAHSSS